MRALPLLAALVVLGLASAQGGSGNLLENGEIDGPRAWNHTMIGTSALLEVDRREGASKKGCLRIANDDPDDRAPHNWRQTVTLPEKNRPARLKLSAMVRIEGSGPGSEACVMVQLLPEEGSPLGYGRCPELRSDVDWTPVESVFEVPDGVEKVFLMAYYVGQGTARFDDLRIVETDEEVTQVAAPAAQRSDGRHEKLARGCAADLDWCFDAETARARAAEEGKPILVYVRCTDDRENIQSALESVRADQIRFLDDGYAKDLLFRAGPLSDADVHAMIERRFVPVCLTYILGDHTYGAESPPGWASVGAGEQLTFGSSAIEGDSQPGCLTIRNGDHEDRRPHNWRQSFEPRMELPVVLTLSASMKASGFETGSEACVMVQCWRGDEALGYGRVREVIKDTDWAQRSAKFTVPRGTERVNLLAYLVGGGEVCFDDLDIRDAKRGDEAENLLANGELDQLSGARLGGFELSPRELTTPALVVLDASGEPVRKLHRIGTQAPDLIDHWLRDALAELGSSSSATEPSELLLAGDLEGALRASEGETDEEGRLAIAAARRRMGELGLSREALKGLKGTAATLERALIEMREGEWEKALKVLDRAEDDADEEVRFRRAWCLNRLGRRGEARVLWVALAGESLVGRRSAACLLSGPRLPYALSERLWPRDSMPLDQTELGRPEGFDPEQTITLLLEMQRADGSFGGHLGPTGQGWTDAAITGIVLDALRAWKPKVSPSLRKDVSAAHERALAWLVAWPDTRVAGSKAFNNPYALMTLVAEGEKAAAEKVVQRIAESQLPDGNWTVYQAERPASFNTALNVMALVKAKKARIEIPKQVLSDGVAALEAMRQENDLFPYSTMTGHEWMTTEHGSVARDSLCEHTLLLAGEGSKKKLSASLERYARHAHELRKPTKRLYDYFNSRGHGGYYFFFAHRNAMEASELASSKAKKKAQAFARDAVLSAREGDGTFMDQYMLGRAYGTAMAPVVLAK